MNSTSEHVSGNAAPLQGARCFFIGTLALAAALLGFQLWHVFHDPIWRDDAFIASVAKNLANGRGYSATFFDKTYPFHFGISTGPVIVLPAAAMMLAFGNQYWVPGVTIVGIIWTLLIGIFFASPVCVGRERRWQFCFLALLYCFIASYVNFGADSGDMLGLWHLMMGDIPAVLCVILAALLLYSPVFNCRLLFAGGLALGAAALCKLSTLLAAAILLARLAAWVLRPRARPLKERMKWLICAALGAALPVAALELVKLGALGWEAYVGALRGNGNFVAFNGINGGVPISLWEHAGRQLPHVMAHFGLAGVAVLLPFTGWVLYMLHRQEPDAREAGLRYGGETLLLAAFVHLLWWMFCAPLHSERYFIPAYFYYFTALALLLPMLRYKTRMKRLIVVLCMMAFATKSVELLHYLFVLDFRPTTRLKEQLYIADKLVQQQKQGTVLVACSDNFELEYLMPGSGNFRYCKALRTEHFDKPVLLATYYSYPGRMLTILADEYGGHLIPLPERIAAQCPTPLVETKNYFLHWCDGTH
jgi:hypothetical protein